MSFKRLSSLKTFFVALVAVLGVFSSTQSYATEGGGKELTGVITDVINLDGSDKELIPDKDGVFQFRTGNANKYRVLFDLSKYDNNLSNGDYFTFTIPEPITLYNPTTSDLLDGSTKVPIATAVVTSKGKGKGGNVKVTLKNLEEFLAKKGGNSVVGVEGNFAAAFLFESDQDKKPITFNGPEMKKNITHTYTSKTHVAGPEEGYENFAKNGGQVSQGAWTSERLKALFPDYSGDYYSAWRVRVNTGNKDLGANLVLKDYIPQVPEYAKVRYIPESLKVYHYPGLTSGTAAITNAATLVTENIDYSVKWNENFTAFDITFFDGSRPYFVFYNTTTPNDGSEVGNSVELHKADGTQLTQRSNNARKVSTQSSRSLFSGVIVADSSFKITINKKDVFTLAPLANAEFTITAPNGQETTVVTDNKGVATSQAFSQDLVGQVFKVKEKKAPEGYKLDETIYPVKLVKSGNIINLTNEPIPALLDITASKILTGYNKKLVGEDFTFELLDGNGNKVAEAKNDASGNISFRDIKFKSPGIYNYSIREVNDNQLGITYVQDAQPVVIEVTGTNGSLKAETTTQPVVFNNTYKPAPVKVNFEATKTLTGRELVEGEFEFVLSKAGAEVKSTNNTKDGQVRFEDIEITEPGNYTYTITEKPGTISGVQYDNLVITAEVAVTDNGNGQLEANVTYSTDKEFNNTYTAEAITKELQVTKVLEGRQLQADEFEFVLTELSNGGQSAREVATVKNDATGQVVFTGLTYNAPGVHTYKIAEINTAKSGVTYDTMEVTATVTVTDNGQGKLVADVQYSADTEFNNSYKAGATTATLSATKVLEGRALQEGEFEFVLTELSDGGQSAREIETVKNNLAGQVVFSALTFNKPGVHNYKIVEINTAKSGVTYDTMEVTATVTVTDNGQGKLVADVQYSADTEFNNSYKAGATTATLSATKVLEGRALQEGEFEFELKNGDQVLETVTNKADGSLVFAPLSFDAAGEYTYTIVEKAGSLPHITYSTNPVTATVVVTDNAGRLEAVVTYEGGNQTITNTYTAPKTNITVTKAWDDADNQDGKRPTEVEAALLANGKEVKKVVLSAANNWTATVEGLASEENGMPLVYTVSEKTTVDGYTTVVTGDKEQGFVITNSRKPETITVKATKEWDDANNQDGKRPEKITVNLLADGMKVDTKDVTADAQGKWEVNFENLPKYKAGQEIKYTVTEETVAEYEALITDFNIVNKYLPKQIEYKVTKVWNDANNQDGKRPESITVQLYKSVKGGEAVAVDGQTLTLSAANKVDDNTWSASFMNLPQFEAGQEVTYSVQEVNVPAGYAADVKGQQITNSYTPETVVLTGSKVWNDMNNQDGKRVDMVTVEILQGNVVVDTIQVSEATGWTFTSKPLPKYANGQVITYTVKEVAVAHYTTEVTNKDGQYTITNTHTPEKVTVSGTKTWNDANNHDGKRPESITVALLADGVVTGQTVVVTGGAAERWAYSFGELDRYKDGKEIVYSVQEVNVPEGYKSVVNGMNLVNNYTPKPRVPNDYPIVDLPNLEIIEVPVPNEPKKTPEAPKPVAPVKTAKTGTKKPLPKTGSVESYMAILAGLVLLGGAVVLKKKR